MACNNNNSNSARRRIFDGRGGSKLIALTSLGPGRLCQMEPASARGEGCRTAHCRGARSDNTIGRTLKKHSRAASHWQQWVILPDANAAFVSYAWKTFWNSISDRTIRSARSCASTNAWKQLIIDTRAFDPRQTWTTSPRHDYEYERNGVANLFIVLPRRWKAGGMSRLPTYAPHRTSITAHGVKICPIRIFQMRRKSMLGRITLNIHKPASIYEAFPRQRPAGSSSASR